MTPRVATLLGFLLVAWIPGALPVACQGKEPGMSEDEKRRRIGELYAKYRRKFPEVEGVSASELQERRERGELMVLVDVRQPEEQAISMIPGAITATEFERRQDEFRDHLVVTYCTAGYRSGLYAGRLRAEGWRVANLEGSLLAWTHADLPLVDSEGPTRRVHVYGPDWNLAAAGYEPVW